MKLRKLSIALLMVLVSANLSSCDSGTGTSNSVGISIKDVDLENVQVSFWNPITGPDAVYMQDLIKNFNDAYKGKIEIKADSQAEANHYQRILTSFSDNSTADLCMVHKSRLSTYHRANKLRDMTNLLEEIELKEEDYVADNWSSGEFDGKMYGITYDILPIVLFYNRNLIPEGYTEDMILSDDFTVDTMLEMMKLAYKDAPIANKKVYGMAFNYGYTENMFISFLNQQGAHIVDPANPTVPTYANEAGYAAAEALRSIPFTKNADGIKTASESGTDHLNVFMQGRALFTIDGIWSAPDACNKEYLEKLNTGVALLPKVNETANRSVFADGHSLVMFNNSSMNADKDLAMQIFIEYLIDNTAYWCQGGKIASRSDVYEDESYKQLEWAYLSNKLSSFVSPDKVYTFDTLANPIGKYVAELCEGTLTDVKAAIDQAAQDAKQAAEKI